MRGVGFATPGVLGLLLLLGGPALLLGGPARAATWTTPVAIGQLEDADGLVRLPGGVALRLEPGKGGALPTVGEQPSVRDAETGELVMVEGPLQPVDQRGVPAGLLIPASPTTRLLRVEPADGPLRARTTTRREQLAAWMELQRALDRAGRARGGRQALDLDDLALPWGSRATLAELRLRARSVADRAVRALGTAHDLAPLLPLHRTTHAASSERMATIAPGQPWEVDLAGPGTLVLRLRPRTEQHWIRTRAAVFMDGEALEPMELVGSGTVFTTRRFFVPPGVHQLSVAVEDTDTDMRLEMAQLRRPAFGPPVAGSTHRAQDPASAAELAWLRSERDTAREAWRGLLDAPGATGELARARVLRLSDDPDELARLADLPADMSEDGVEACVDAILERALELPPEQVEAALGRARDPDVARVASWLDSLDGRRPRGAALLRAALPLVDDGRELFDGEQRHRLLRTRFQDLDPEGDAVAVTRMRTRGPGTPRVSVGAGEAVDLDLPEWDGRRPVLRLRLPQGATWRLDGEAWSAGAGELTIGLSAGLHRLEVDSGEVIVLDRELAPAGRPVYEATLHALPARWVLPDVGARVDLRLTVEPPVPVRLVDDDGRVQELHPDATGVVTVTAGTWSRRLVVTRAPAGPEDAAGPAPPEQVLVGLEMRTRLSGPPGPPPQPVADVPAALDELADLSRAIDAGFATARLARAALLGRMGLLSAARRDLRVLLEQEEDRALREQARALAANLAPATPSTLLDGPADVPTALAAHADTRDLPPLAPDPPVEGSAEARALALEAAAAELDEPALWLGAAEAWWEAGSPTRAWAAADRAGAAGEDLRGTLLARTRWSWLRYAQGGLGLVRVPPPPEQPDDGPVWRQARAAMLAPPWEGPEVTVLRGDGAEVVQLPAGDAEISLFCRDESGPGLPCRVPLRLGEAKTRLEVADAEESTLFLPLSAPVELELGAPGSEHALLVRVRVDGELVGSAPLRTALRAGPGHPVSAVVGGPVLVQVESLRGEGRVLLDGVEVATTRPGTPGIVAVTRTGPHRVEVVGDLDLRLHASLETRPPGDDVAGLPDDLLNPDQSELPVDVDAIFSWLGASPMPDLRAPARHGSTELWLSGLSTLVYTPQVERWQAVEPGIRWLWAPPGWWSQAAVRGRFPRAAGQVLAEGGPTWPGGFAGLRVDAAIGSSDDGPAGEVGARLITRQDLALSRQLSLRLQGRFRAAWLSEQVDAAVDPIAWSLWRDQHPVYADGQASLVGSPTRDLRWQLGVAATSNTGPSLDSIGPRARADLLLPAGTVLGARARLDWRFADEHRAEDGVGGAFDLDVEHGAWRGERHWWRVWAALGWRFAPQELVGGVGLRLLLSPRAGLRDMPPGSLAFRDLRELP